VYDGQQLLLIVVMFKQRQRQSLTSRGAKKSFRGHMASVEGWEMGRGYQSVSERLSLQRLLQINVVHNRPLVEKKMGLFSC